MRQFILPVEHGQDAVANSEEPDASTEQSPAPDLEDEATENIDAAADKFDEITPIMAQQLINKYRAITTDLGCWESEKKPDMRYGHTYVQLRKLGVLPMLHQLAVIATNRGDKLKTTLGVSGRTGLHVSHLCHNGKCFNPEHIIVESMTNNLRRKCCNGRKVITYGDFTYHPCQHGEVEKMRKCILPALRLEAGHHENVSE
jgi:hypothetical protein